MISVLSFRERGSGGRDQMEIPGCHGSVIHILYDPGNEAESRRSHVCGAFNVQATLVLYTAFQHSYYTH